MYSAGSYRPRRGKRRPCQSQTARRTAPFVSSSRIRIQLELPRRGGGRQRSSRANANRDFMGARKYETLGESSCSAGTAKCGPGPQPPGRAMAAGRVPRIEVAMRTRTSRSGGCPPAAVMAAPGDFCSINASAIQQSNTFLRNRAAGRGRHFRLRVERRPAGQASSVRRRPLQRARCASAARFRNALDQPPNTSAWMLGIEQPRIQPRFVAEQESPSLFRIEPSARINARGKAKSRGGRWREPSGVELGQMMP